MSTLSADGRRVVLGLRGWRRSAPLLVAMLGLAGCSAQLSGAPQPARETGPADAASTADRSDGAALPDQAALRDAFGAADQVRPTDAGAVADSTAPAADGAVGLPDASAPAGPHCRSVRVGGGGYVTGIFAHPTVKDLIYLRTDVGGFYRWDPVGAAWLPLNDAFPYDEKQSMRGLGLALDPADPDAVYIAGGAGAGGKIYKSANRGATWTSVHTLYVDGNAEYRWTGERMAVDPFDPSIVLFGSQQDGLLVGKAKGTSWSVAAGIPKGSSPVGINAVAFDPTQAGRVYAASRGNGVYVSTDHGGSFAQLPGSPVDVNHLAVASDATVYVTQTSGLSRFAAGAFTKLALSAPAGFNSLAVAPQDPQHVLVAEHGQWTTKIYRTTNGGTTWTPLSVAKVSTVPWWPAAYFANWSASLLFDPVVPGRVWQTDWFGIWRTDDITATKTTWTAYEQGHEQVVVHDLLALPSGVELISGVADVGGFLHASLQDCPAQSLGRSDNTFVNDNYSLAVDPTNPLRILRVGGDHNSNESWGFISADGGSSWATLGGAPPGKAARRIVHSAGGGKSLLIIEDYGQPYLNSDGTGSSWTPLAGLPQQGPYGPWVAAVRAAADGKKSDTFYYVLDNKLYVSQEGGAFAVVSSSIPTPSSSNLWSFVNLVATPGAAEELWLSLEKVGLFRLTGPSFAASPVGGFSSAFAVDLGKPAPGATSPTLFVSGVRNGKGGLYYSTDDGATFTDVTDPERQVILRARMAASRQTYGRVFLGFEGRGVFVCDAGAK